MITALPCKTGETVDMTGISPLHVMAKIFEMSTSGTPVIVSFGGGPEFLVSKTTIYKLVPASGQAFKSAIPAGDERHETLWEEH